MKTSKYVVVFFDICSSSNIIEDLKLSDSLEKWTAVLKALEAHLSAASGKMHFEMHKFLGDGWILIFNDDTMGAILMDALRDLAKAYIDQFNSVVKDCLSRDYGPPGLTFGVDRGELHKIKMKLGVEYIGRCLNVAAAYRAQSKTRTKALRIKYSLPTLHTFIYSQTT